MTTLFWWFFRRSLIRVAIFVGIFFLGYWFLKMLGNADLVTAMLLGVFVFMAPLANQAFDLGWTGSWLVGLPLPRVQIAVARTLSVLVSFPVFWGAGVLAFASIWFLDPSLQESFGKTFSEFFFASDGPGGDSWVTGKKIFLGLVGILQFSAIWAVPVYSRAIRPMSEKNKKRLILGVGVLMALVLVIPLKVASTFAESEFAGYVLGATMAFFGTLVVTRTLYFPAKTRKNWIAFWGILNAALLIVFFIDARIRMRSTNAETQVSAVLELGGLSGYWSRESIVSLLVRDIPPYQIHALSDLYRDRFLKGKPLTRADLSIRDAITFKSNPVSVRAAIMGFKLDDLNFEDVKLIAEKLTEVTKIGNHRFQDSMDLFYDFHEIKLSLAELDQLLASGNPLLEHFALLWIRIQRNTDGYQALVRNMKKISEESRESLRKTLNLIAGKRLSSEAFSEVLSGQRSLLFVPVKCPAIDRSNWRRFSEVEINLCIRQAFVQKHRGRWSKWIDDLTWVTAPYTSGFISTLERALLAPIRAQQPKP